MAPVRMAWMLWTWASEWEATCIAVRTLTPGHCERSGERSPERVEVRSPRQIVVVVNVGPRDIGAYADRALKPPLRGPRRTGNT
jgi:hypothetical protein